MGDEYIKREDAIRIARLQGKHAQFDGMAQDVAPVRHGRWVSINEYPYEKCSICGETHGTVRCLDKYCPNCGAKMDEEVEA